MQATPIRTQRNPRMNKPASDDAERQALRARLLGLIVRNEEERTAERGKEIAVERAAPGMRRLGV